MPPRLKPTRLEYLLDGARLRSQLAAYARDAYGDPVEQRRRAIEVLKAALFRGRMIAKERLENGAGGMETSRLLCGVTDEVVRALWDFALTWAVPSAQGQRLTLMAVGGYGRGALAPFSDIDLLFLRDDENAGEAEKLIEFVLYALWDLGFKVGHASRTVEECLSLARSDMTIRTALLEARPLIGEPALGETLRARFRAEVVAGTGPEFIAAKLAERDARHARAGASRFMVEPNLKEGKGGLRDLNTLFWIAQYLHPAADVDAVIRLEMFEGHEVRAFLRAFEFLESVRAHLHFATGRAEERLTFDLQPEIARRMGYQDRARPGGERTPAVERFMRRYFLVAKDVGVLTRVFAAQLEADHLKTTPGRTDALKAPPLPGERIGEAFIVEGGRLSVVERGVFDADPVNLLRLFHLAGARGLDLHPEAVALVTRKLGLITARVRRDPAAARVFLDILAHSANPQRLLELMNEAGVLGRYIPEWGHIVAKMQFNMYHAYTVDEHTLRAVGVIGELAAGRLHEDHPVCSAILPLIEDREALYLAMLLHDTGKGGVGGQERAGARAARQVCERLGLEAQRIELVAWLVEHHLEMSDFAQKRDIADPATVAAFVDLVQTPERMRLLLVLTTADIRAVAPGVWNGWKGQLLRELFAAAETVFRGGRVSDAAGMARRRQEATAYDARAALVGHDPSARSWAAAMEDAYFANFTRAEQAAHVELSRRAAQNGGGAAKAQVRPRRMATEVVVAARDRRGLFADLALAIARIGGNLVGARIFTSQSGDALDVFYVQDAQGRPFGEETARGLDRLTRALEAAARGEVNAAAPARPRADLSRASAFAISPTVVIDNEASPAATIIETSGRDRPGLLHALARALADANLSIQSAHVDNYGERAVDAFYVVTPTGAKLTNPGQAARVRQGLLEVFDAADAPHRQRRLASAEASGAR